jgi:spermidine synthase
MSYEVIWTKLLGLIVGPTTYSFTIVLVTFILGLALGNMVFGWLTDRTEKAIWLLIFTQIVAGLSVLGVSQLIGNSQLFFAKLIFVLQEHFALLSIANAVALFCFMIVPTFCLGATFPLVGKIYTRSVSRVGRSIGLAYAINTIGAVSGSFCAGFLLIPLIGKEKGLSLVIGLQLVTSLVVATAVVFENRGEILKWAFITAPAVAGFFLCFYFPMWNRQLLSSRGKYYRFDRIQAEVETAGWMEALLQGSDILIRSESEELVYYGDGIGGFTTVVKQADPLGNIDYSMIISGKTDASSRGDMETQTLAAHFPMLFHRQPRKVMVLGLASGVTAGEVLCYPVERLDVIDINKQVVEASNFFIPWNNNVLSNPKTNLIIQDGRAHLQLTEEKYDVIISEPSNPWMAGLATLFTRDFFAIVKDRLNEDGIFAQFMHSYSMDWPTFALVGRTFADVFPNSILVATAPFGPRDDYFLVGFKGSKGLILDNAKQQLRYAQRSKNVTFPDARLLYRLIVAEDLQSLFGPGPVNTDSRPRLEFAAPKLMHHIDLMVIRTLLSKRQLSAVTMDIIKQVTKDIDAQIDFAVFALSLYSPFPDMVDLSRATALQKQRFFELMDSYCAKNLVDDSVFKDEEMRRRCCSIQIEARESNIDAMPDKALSYFYLANRYYTRGMLDEAVANYAKSLQIKPDNAEVHYDLAQVLAEQGKLDVAASHFLKALELKPNYYEAHSKLGVILAQEDRLEEAIKHFTEALRIKPDFADAHNDLGLALTHQGKLDRAIIHFSEALRIRPNFANAHSNLAYTFVRQGKLDQAIKHFTDALKIKPDSANIQNDIGVLFARQGRLDKAIEHFTEAVRIEPNLADAQYNLKKALLKGDKLK